MTLESCLKCKYHVSYQTGYVICNMWKHREQHVVNKSGADVVLVVGCPKEDAR